ncbi:MAG TPA: DUF5320 domain-containing protein [Bacteroidales bacterium]|nr:DUF5320 domain-containing protein [Bacteroidales bacterium]
MPNLNQTGPEGNGPMTGRRMGRCTNYGRNAGNSANTNTEAQNMKPYGYFNREDYGLRGIGRGRGMGRQNRFRGGF